MAQRRPPTPVGAGLSTERVVAEAIRIADREGVERLSMRGLAAALDAGAMSLYHYVANKEELLDAMIDVVFDEIAVPSLDVDWTVAMRAESVSAHEVLARHPWAISLMESRTSPGPANLRHREAVTACLRRAGFSIEMATHANWLLSSHVYGYALQEASLPFGTAEELADMTEEVYLPQVPAELYPSLHESGAHLLAIGYDPSQEFLFGLDLVLAALEALRPKP
ncbi:TetR/AcrR family transcriptional regulator C-terminal domain-containing protein [Microbacterium hominis]|uniref:TetR/AcrR family transcriptional regulator n=1 Tax=Microbacterium hominis TaxID=162426 RepID=UPI001963CD24|nr:TetR/AcrR family transcriptional regulator C-terminal domain-containing protein [Microbacterium hominis]QRY39686.1 TetR/AcrR family transcriptional regulator C-terminal domain-containing protein [Microbacterium hominis]